jgi:hypothetical protein
LACAWSEIGDVGEAAGVCVDRAGFAGGVVDVDSVLGSIHRVSAVAVYPEGVTDYSPGLHRQMLPWVSVPVKNSTLKGLKKNRWQHIFFNPFRVDFILQSIPIPHFSPL